MTTLLRDVTWEQRGGAVLALQWDGTFSSTLPPYSGPWQRELLRALDRHDMVAVRMPRQTGKTRGLRAATAGTVAIGGGVLVGMPTLVQSGRVFMDELNDELRTIAPMLGMKTTKREGLSSRWNTGGKIIAMSLSGEAKVEGVTGGLLIIDEAHDIEVAAFEKLYPAIAQAIRAGTFKVIFTGIGSLHSASLLVQARKRMGAFDLHITPEEIVAADSSYARVFDQFRATMTAAGYRRNIDCLDADAGLHAIYPVITERAAYHAATLHQRPRYYFGIDVGLTSDETVVAVLETRAGGIANLVDVFRTAGRLFGQQAVEVKAFIDRYPYRQEDIHCETNGLGAGLYSALVESGWGRISGIHVTIQRKAALIERAQKMMETQALGIQEAAWRNELGALQFEHKGVTEDKTEWDHSDLHSALLMALSAMGGDVGYAGALGGTGYSRA